jgi:hypothetical protein
MLYPDRDDDRSTKTIEQSDSDGKDVGKQIARRLEQCPSLHVTPAGEPNHLGVASGDILPPESGQATVIELQPVHGIDSS